MSTSNGSEKSLGNVILQASMQLSAPLVTLTNSTSEKLRSHTVIEDISLRKKIRCNLSSLSVALAKHSHLHKRKARRETVSQAVSPKSEPRSGACKNHNDREMAAAVTSPSKSYLSSPPYSPYTRSSSCSSSQHQHPRSQTLAGIWPGLYRHNVQSSTSALFEPTFLDERVKKHTPSWKACSKVVTSLLTFTRTKKERYEWIQLVGHPGTFKEGVHDGYVMKALLEHERHCCELLQTDALKDFVPKYNGTIQDDEGKAFIEMEDLLATFHEPCIMDCKIGVRTYLEEELDKSERDPEPRADLYDKMIAIDPLAPTEEEREERKILKPRYMLWRESVSSSQELGFRIEAIKKSRGLMSKEFQRIKQRHEVKKQLSEFIASSLPHATRYLQRLTDLRATCARSNFFQTHELIGSSLLFVHDGRKSSIWMIDFGKTRLLPKGIHTTHLRPWTRGSHEDGYLLGLDNLISLLEEIVDELKHSS